jgi:hypothetical protein
VAGILWRRNWDVLMMSLNVTRVRTYIFCICHMYYHYGPHILLDATHNRMFC